MKSDYESEDYFRVVESADGWEFHVATVSWPSPSTPQTNWLAFRHWKTRPDAKRVAKAREAAFAKPEFYRTCTRCEELNNIGHMHDDQICQSCAERYFHVVY